MILAHIFTRAEENDYESLAASSGRLRALLEAFAEDRLPSNYGPEELAGYGKSLLKARREDGSFSSYENLDELEPDVRTDAHRFVTWAALAYLCRLRAVHSKEAAGIDGLDEVIRMGLRSPCAADFSFPESGDAAVVQQVEAVLLLSTGHVPKLLENDADLAPELKAALDGMAAEFRRKLESGDTKLIQGIDYAALYAQAAAALGGREPGR